MSADQSKNQNDVVKIIAYVIPSLPTLLLKLGLFYLRFKGMASKAGKIFKEELMDNGVDEQTAEQFTQEYLKSSHVAHLMRQHS